MRSYTMNSEMNRTTTATRSVPSRFLGLLLMVLMAIILLGGMTLFSSTVPKAYAEDETFADPSLSESKAPKPNFGSAKQIGSDDGYGFYIGEEEEPLTLSPEWLTDAIKKANLSYGLDESGSPNKEIYPDVDVFEPGWHFIKVTGGTQHINVTIVKNGDSFDGIMISGDDADSVEITYNYWPAEGYDPNSDKNINYTIKFKVSSVYKEEEGSGPGAVYGTNDIPASSAENEYFYGTAYSGYKSIWKATKEDEEGVSRAFPIVLNALVPMKEVGQEGWFPDSSDQNVVWLKDKDKNSGLGLRHTNQWTANGGFNFEVAYCADSESPTSLESAQYKIAHVKGLDEFTPEQQKKLQAIIEHAYPFISADDMYKAIKEKIKTDSDYCKKYGTSELDKVAPVLPNLPKDSADTDKYIFKGFAPEIMMIATQYLIWNITNPGTSSTSLDDIKGFLPSFSTTIQMIGEDNSLKKFQIKKDNYIDNTTNFPGFNYSIEIIKKAVNAVMDYLDDCESSITDPVLNIPESGWNYDDGVIKVSGTVTGHKPNDKLSFQRNDNGRWVDIADPIILTGEDSYMFEFTANEKVPGNTEVRVVVKGQRQDVVEAMYYESEEYQNFIGGHFGNVEVSDIATFTTKPPVGSLAISKTVTNDNSDTSWNFTLTLTGGTGEAEGPNAVVGPFDYTITNSNNNVVETGSLLPVGYDGEKDDIQAESAGTWNFKLKHGQTLTVDGLPEGTKYVVQEYDYTSEGYVTNSSTEVVGGENEEPSNVKPTAGRSAEGSIEGKKTSEVSFENIKVAPVDVSLDLKKTYKLDSDIEKDANEIMALSLEDTDSSSDETGMLNVDGDEQDENDFSDGQSDPGESYASDSEDENFDGENDPDGSSQNEIDMIDDTGTLVPYEFIDGYTLPKVKLKGEEFFFEVRQKEKRDYDPYFTANDKKDGDCYVKSIPNGENGVINLFDNVKYDYPGEYSYIVTETKPGDPSTIKYDSSKYEVVIEVIAVKEDGKFTGALDVVKHMYRLSDKDERAEEIPLPEAVNKPTEAFTNYAGVKANLTVKGTKQFLGGTFANQGGQFTFKIEGVKAYYVPEKVSDDSSIIDSIPLPSVQEGSTWTKDDDPGAVYTHNNVFGRFDFGSIEFPNADQRQVYWYKITEVITDSADPLVEYDDTAYFVEVEIPSVQSVMNSLGVVPDEPLNLDAFRNEFTKQCLVKYYRSEDGDFENVDQAALWNNEAQFTNRAKLRVEKVVDGIVDTQDKFDFNIDLFVPWNEEGKNQAISYSIYSQNGTASNPTLVESEPTEDNKGPLGQLMESLGINDLVTAPNINYMLVTVSVQLADGEYVVFDGLPQNTYYRVSEAESDNYSTTWNQGVYAPNSDESLADSNRWPMTGNQTIIQILDYRSYTRFVNTPEGDLSVTKTVTGGGGETDREFRFTVTLDDDTINGGYGPGQFSGQNRPHYSDDAPYMEFVDGVATFTLRQHETKTAVGLPAGIGYTVVEEDADQDGYTTTVPDNAEGTIAAGETVEVEVVNHKEPGEQQKTETNPGDGRTVRVGQEITYEIQWYNNAVDENREPIAAPVIVYDPLDVGLTYVSASNPGYYTTSSAYTLNPGYNYRGVVVWDLGTQPAGAHGTLSLTVRVNENALSRVYNRAAVHVGNDWEQTEIPENPVYNPENPENPQNPNNPNNPNEDIPDNQTPQARISTTPSTNIDIADGSTPLSSAPQYQTIPEQNTPLASATTSPNSSVQIADEATPTSYIAQTGDEVKFAVIPLVFLAALSAGIVIFALTSMRKLNNKRMK